MKTKLFYLVIVISSFKLIAQNDGWHQYTKPLHVNEMVKDASGNYHYATNIGYQKLDSNFNTIETKNLTSQSSPIGNCFSVAVNPSNENEIALGENERVFIFSNGVETHQFAVNATTQFTGPSLYYNDNDELYVFNKNDFSTQSYSIFKNGVLTEMPTPGIVPIDIVENNTGTKIFIAGSNNGLWEYTKATDTWVNFTKENSNMLNNFINDLFMDANDNLFAGSFEGINKIEPNGTITSCQPPSFSPVFEIDVHPSSGQIVARTSQPNSANNFGFNIVDFDTCAWTSFTNDGNSCVSENMFKTVQFTSTPTDGKIVASGAILSAENTYTFDPANPSNSCDYLDFNYMGVPLRIDTNYTTDVNVRKTSDGKIDIAACNGSETMYYVSISPETFDGTFPTAASVPLPSGKRAFSILRDNGYFILDNDEGFSFIDENDNISSFNHNIPNNLTIISKKVSVANSNDGIINIMYKAFDAVFNYIIYKAQCNTNTRSCSQPEETFKIDRDKSKNISFDASIDKVTNEVVAVAVKTNASGDIRKTQEKWDRTTNGTPVVSWDEVHPIFPILDVLFVGATLLRQGLSLFVLSETILKGRATSKSTGNPVEQDSSFDEDNDGNPDKIKALSKSSITTDEANEIVIALVAVANNGFSVLSLFEEYNGLGNKNSSKAKVNNTVNDADFNGSLPNDIFIKKFELFQYNTTEAIIVVFTNYGLLVKTGIDITGLTLGTDTNQLSGNKTLLYPNPTKGIVAFSDHTIKNIKVYDMNGRNVLNGEGNTISVKTLSKGIYIIKGTTSENTFIAKKLIKN
ncbi:hypothetical protein GCM10023311_15680 [Flaviramulus aquimarinus]|uniref:Secretion system C-terminal sorting domain-containing protein n=1 Tax=Flaviramulus aquimarinus TaxID=1170456 RepID=A0ABP9F2J2_9FLAO